MHEREECDLDYLCNQGSEKVHPQSESEGILYQVLAEPFRYPLWSKQCAMGKAFLSLPGEALDVANETVAFWLSQRYYFRR